MAYRPSREVPLQMSEMMWTVSWKAHLRRTQVWKGGGVRRKLIRRTIVEWPADGEGSWRQRRRATTGNEVGHISQGRAMGTTDSTHLSTANGNRDAIREDDIERWGMMTRKGDVGAVTGGDRGESSC